MGFWIYFVSVTRLSLQIKSKLIFLTATWVHPAGVCRASCVPWVAGTRDETAAACWWLRGAPTGRRQISKGLLALTREGEQARMKAHFTFWQEKSRQDLCGLKD